jgi:hypothetical protein
VRAPGANGEDVRLPPHEQHVVVADAPGDNFAFAQLVKRDASAQVTRFVGHNFQLNASMIR